MSERERARLAQAESLAAGDVGRWPIAAIGRYVRDEYFNPGLVRSLVPDPRLAVAASVVWVIIAAWHGRSELSTRAPFLLAGLIVLAPNVFPWYGVWLVPFLAVRPSVPLIAFTGAVGYAYSFFLTQPWAIPPWARLVEAVPMGAAIALGLPTLAARGRGTSAGGGGA